MERVLDFWTVEVGDAEVAGVFETDAADVTLGVALLETDVNEDRDAVGVVLYDGDADGDADAPGVRDADPEYDEVPVMDRLDVTDATEVLVADAVSDLEAVVDEEGLTDDAGVPDLEVEEEEDGVVL
jgi:hypothetical protein